MPPLDTATSSRPQGLVSIPAAISPIRFDVPDALRAEPGRAPHPLADEAHLHTVDWAWGHGLVEPWSELYHRFCAAHFGAVAARYFPTVTAPQLDLAADLFTWFFFHGESLDDHIATHPVLYAEAIETERLFVKVLSGAALPDRMVPLSRAMGDLRRRLCREAGSAQAFDRFARSVERHLQGQRWQRLLRRRDETPGLTTYRRLRLMAGTATPSAELAALFVAESEGDAPFHPSLERLKVLAANCVNWAGDLTRSETPEATSAGNLVQVLRHEHACTSAEAHEKAVRMCDREIRSFSRLATQLASSEITASGFRPYVRALELMVRGILDSVPGDEPGLTVH